MNNTVWQDMTETSPPLRGWRSVALLFFFSVLFLCAPQCLFAQEVEQTGSDSSESESIAEEPGEAPDSIDIPIEITVSLPASQQMAMALATPDTRRQALLDLAAAANVLSKADSTLELNHAALAQGFLDDRTWLQILVERYGWVEPRNSVLDPAAWLVLRELQQHEFEDMSLVFPGHTPRNVLVFQVFQRSLEQVSAANLPDLLLEVEADAISIWDAFLQVSVGQELQDAAWKAVETSWFTDRFLLPETELTSDTEADVEAATESKPESDTEEQLSVVANVSQAMSKMVLSAVDARPPDSKTLIQTRVTLLNSMPSPSAGQNTGVREQVMDTLYLVSLIDGLHEGRYFNFTQGLLAITTGLLEVPIGNAENHQLVDWLVAELPAISAHYAVYFARVDPRLNVVLSAVYGVLLKISSAYENVVVEDISAVIDPPESEGEINEVVDITPVPVQHPDIKSLRVVLADAVAQLALIIPDMDFYSDTPVRARIAEEINICISIAASLDEEGGIAMTRRQFDACMETLLQLADQETRLAELSGNMNGPFTTDTLRRELNVSPWQRINYALGYLYNRRDTDCKAPVTPLPNPLEWSVLATTMAWFAGNSPEFVRTPENEARLTKMRDIGEQLMLALVEQTTCLSSTDTGINDLVSRGITDYELAWRELELGVENAETAFRTERLRPGADIQLEKDASQQTNYRPDDLVIETCNQQTICEMSGELSTTRALIGLFPDEYLVAEQTGMGQIGICYRNMEWVQRRSELVRADDENVANYFGHLGFDLVGRYVENGVSTDIFDFRFTSPEEHHYLFAQTSEEVLNDSCPVEWVGSRVVTPLRENRMGIVPDRLTYLAASRKLPSRLIQNNWDKGAEWRDWFVTGIGVESLDLPERPDIMSKLNQHLKSLYEAEQDGIYKQVLLPMTRNSEGEDVSLFDEMSQVSIAKALVRMQMMLFYPDSLLNSDKIRTAVAGDEGLLEGRTMRRFREENVALTSVNGIALDRLNKLRSIWFAQPEAIRRKGSVSASLMNAMIRINILYRQFFTSRPEPLQEVELPVRSEPSEQVES